MRIGISNLRIGISNFCFIIRFTWKNNKSLGAVILLEAVNIAIMPFCLIYLTKHVMDGLERGDGPGELLMAVLSYSAVYLLLSVLRDYISWVRTKKSMKAYDAMTLLLAQKAADIDLIQMEEASTLNLFLKANDSIWNGSIGVFSVLVSLINIILQLCGYAYLFSKISPAFFLAFLPLMFVYLFIDKKRKAAAFQNYSRSSEYKRKENYLPTVMTHPEKGKDIRLYSAGPKLIRELMDNQKGFFGLFRKNSRWDMWQSILNHFLSFILRFFIYGYFAIQFFQNRITIGDFSVFIVATEALYKNLLGIPSTFLEFWNNSLRIENFIAFLKKPVTIQTYDARKKIETDRPTLEFQNVSFRYPNAKEFAVKNITFTIHPGEKLTIIGENGSGKSTLFKLLLRLYDPTEGRILLDGVDIREYSYVDYAALFAPMFQDYRIFEFSVFENIALKNDPSAEDCQEILDILKMCGLYEKIEKLPRKGFTTVFHTYDDEGIILSTGEQQKLAVARTIFQKRPIKLYDEPAAAMDVQSEMLLYQSLYKLSLDKTAIFISHRMSSCILADSVLVMDRGKISAIGNHDELLKTSALYNKMWNAQASYYRLDGEEKLING